jgi:hypothetical protein
MRISRQGAKPIDGSPPLTAGKRRAWPLRWLLAGFVSLSILLLVISVTHVGDASAKKKLAATPLSPVVAIEIQQDSKLVPADTTAKKAANSSRSSGATTTATGTAAPLLAVQPFQGTRLTAVAAFQKPRFVRLMESSSRQWLSRAIDTNVVASLPHEKIFLIAYSSKYKAYSIQGHTRMYLTCELNNRVTLDRMWARSFEMWHLSFDASGFLIVKSRRNQKFVRTVGAVNDMLNADVGSDAEATKWAVFEEPTAACSGDVSGAAAKGASSKAALEAMRHACWAPLAGSGSPPGDGATRRNASSAGRRPMLVPLFGSPKPLKVMAPQGSETTDTFTIAQRTLMNWASIDASMPPLIFADDTGTQTLLDNLNHDVVVPPVKGYAGNASAAWHRSTPIRLEKQFEIHKHFNQPTYRGLFAAALQAYPDADAVMYSNSDILYTPALAETLRVVIDYVEREKARKLAAKLPYNVRGWMMVGQRVNHDVPADWSLADDPAWVDTIERQFVNRGELFESDAEDYFIVSRGLLDWMKLPEFIVGGVAFDNWLTNKVNKMAADGLAIEIDGSKTITALHQNHCLGGNHKCSHAHEKSGFNQRLADQHGGWELGHTADAAYATDRRADGTMAVYDKHRLLYA